MRKIYLIIGIVFLTLSFCSFCFSEDFFEEEAGTYQKDFGEVREGEVLTHIFIFKNETSQPLTITEVNTSCGCTASEIEKRRLQPQEATAIKVEFDTKGYSGKVSQSVYLYTDNPEVGAIKLTIKAEVK